MIQVSITLKHGGREIGVDTVATRSEVEDAASFIDLVLKSAAAKLADAVRAGSFDHLPNDLGL